VDATGTHPQRPAGPLRSLLKRVRTSAVRSFERVIGVQTHGDRIRPDELLTEEEIPNNVLPSGWVALWATFRALEVSPDDVFADLGSGKGRVLFMAARRPFKRVLGVERSHHLNRIARANLERTRHRLRCKDIVIQEGTLREWRVPDDLTVAYLYTPLPIEDLGGLLRKLRASVERNPRKFRLVWFLPPPAEIEAKLADWRVEPLRALVPFYLRHRFYERSCISTLDPARVPDDSGTPGMRH
jgi:SAM-dependent methyltransferase